MTCVSLFEEEAAFGEMGFVESAHLLVEEVLISDEVLVCDVR
jgi:hypothetical protein